MRPLLRAALASLFLFAQSAIALHHHEVSPAARSRSAVSIQAPDNCALCSFQIQPRTSTPEPVSVAVSAVAVVVLSSVSAQTPRALRRVRFGARAPPAV